ncbi:DUF5615 family PIN-like protein [Halovivax sp.]|uniref:DUF5615 family PIN-like protein n=1 Tax=Halovivax sp. TaxID=1935978 RepID=UPI0025B90AA5|nr:DUF5615 family PIN-like protein [Halovivax sp.]
MGETTALLLDEHVPRILETTLAANGYETVRADDRFGERTVDAELLDWCRERGYVVLSNDRDFIRLTDDRGHAGIVLYTDPAWVRTEPSEVVALVDRVVEAFASDGLSDRVIWLDAWRDAP